MTLAIKRGIASLTVALALGACGASDQEKLGKIGYVEGFLGGVVADEPQAVLIGRDILSSGGTAVDAAVAVYFTLAVTMPSSASLGGGGVCVVNDGREATRKQVRKSMEEGLGTTQVLDFLPRSPAAIAHGTDRPTAVPGNARGFFALHSRYGRLRWGQLVSPAENLARFGFQVPRVTARELSTVGPALLEDQEAARIFGRRDGQGGPVGEGDFLTQLDLSAVLGRIRASGPGEFYAGPLARQLVEGTRAAGGYLSVEDLRDFAPQWRDSLKVPFNNLVAHFAGPPAAAGVVAAQMWNALDDVGFPGRDGPERQHLLAESAMRAFADRGEWMNDDGSTSFPAEALVGRERQRLLMSGYSPDRHASADSLPRPPLSRPENPAATGFVVVDAMGSAVACVVTMNNLFGTGRVVRGTGILLAAAPDRGGRGHKSLLPMLVVNHNVNDLWLAATATGGVTAPPALVSVAARVLLAGENLEEAVAAPRLHHGGAPDLLYHEPGVAEDLLRAMGNMGYATAPTPVLGLVNAISCKGGLPSKPETCSVRTDPRGFGLSVVGGG